MHGLMMDTQLLVSSILRHAERFHPHREIVSVTADNPLHRYTIADCARRTRRPRYASSRTLLPAWRVIRCGALAPEYNFVRDPGHTDSLPPPSRSTMYACSL